MHLRKLLASVLVCALIFSCTTTFARAAEASSETIVSSRASGSLDIQIPADTIGYVGDWFHLSAGDTITYACTYTPKTASVDFGYIDVDGVFHYLNRTNGSINTSIEVNQRGQYRLVMRNNSSRTIIVTGSVKY